MFSSFEESKLLVVKDILKDLNVEPMYASSAQAVGCIHRFRVESGIRCRTNQYTTFQVNIDHWEGSGVEGFRLQASLGMQKRQNCFPREKPQIKLCEIPPIESRWGVSHQLLKYSFGLRVHTRSQLEFWSFLWLCVRVHIADLDSDLFEFLQKMQNPCK